ncbi:MAG: Six-hairpin glycosidase-like protein [Monoraphidium minutum]|nr:MAG: Six-hairpin glycosidase-like protein [Monoraphidium minutum]
MGARKRASADLQRSATRPALPSSIIFFLILADSGLVALAMDPGASGAPSAATAAAGARAAPSAAAGAPPPAAPPPGAAAARRERVAAAVSQLRELTSDVLGFWLDHGPDPMHGGFHATLERGGAPGSPTDKGIVQQARHCWALSKAAAAPGAPPPGGAGRAEAGARAAWEFINARMRRPDGLCAWLVSRDGATVVDPGPSLYGQFFYIYAAVEFAQAFGDREALAAALAAFRATESAFYDGARGGYDESSSRPRLHALRLPGGGAPRTLNVFLHGIESLTALFEATGDGAVLARLAEMTGILTARLITADDVLYEFYDPAMWAPVGPPSVNFGHNLETAWVASAASRALSRAGRLSAPAAAAAAARLAAVAARALREGYDSERGGVYEAGVPGAPPGAGEGASTLKVWWVQAEALLAASDALRATGDDAYLGYIEGILKFVREHIRDAADGEWVWQTDAAGRVAGPRGRQKGNKWKASYHNVRCLLLLQEWLGPLAA